ncbi:hypothetical protein ACHAXT_004735 [Thalassiosira profunda]
MSADGDAEVPADMTPTEREQWLRDRGIQIETPKDRREAEAVLSGSAEDRPLSIVEQVQRLSLGSDGGNDGIKFVYLPHDTSRSMTTLYLPKRLVDALGPAGDMIPTYIKSFFADGKSIDDTLFKEQAAKQNLIGGDIAQFASAAAKEKGMPEAPDKLTSAALTNATAGGSVETFPLVRPSSTNKNEGVYIYLDEVGLLKHLPNNQRASALAQQCGYSPAPNFYGDVFVGRVSTFNYLHNIDIEEEDIMDTTKEWLVRAPQENLAWQQTVNEVTGRKGETQPGHAGTDGVAVQVESGEDDGCSYSWTQNEEEIEIVVSLSKKVEEGSKVSKSGIKVAFRPQTISVSYNGEPALDLELYSKLDVDGCTWTLDKKNLIVTGEKASDGEIWPRLELSG